MTVHATIFGIVRFDGRRYGLYRTVYHIFKTCIAANSKKFCYLSKRRPFSTALFQQLNYGDKNSDEMGQNNSRYLYLIHTVHMYIYLFIFIYYIYIYFFTEAKAQYFNAILPPLRPHCGEALSHQDSNPGWAVKRQEQ